MFKKQTYPFFLILNKVMFKLAHAGLLYRSWQPVVFGCEADEAAGCWKPDSECAVHDGNLDRHYPHVL